MAQSKPQRWQQLKKRFQELFQLSTKTAHTRILTCGFLVWMVYLPLWLFHLVRFVLLGSSTPVLNGSFAYLGLERLWQQRHEIVRLEAEEDERWVGYALILGGAIAFPFCASSISMQALLVGIVTLGMAYSTWGTEFLKRYWLWITFILLSIYPDWVFLSNAIRKVLTPTYLFEEFMAWIGSLVLQVMGYAATTQGTFIYLPGGAVEIASGCSGFDMAFLIVGSSVVLGLFLKQQWRKIWLVALLGAILALIFNIPRVVMLTLASVYWGKQSFEFWHGPIGGQIFSGVLLTVYYYVAMGFFAPKIEKNQ